ncbi:MAG TPA: hypothetical protein VHX20_04360 [Terracidiphilus sp.]|jgi:hypothetical protein|nr:hypothetical protein [Terracidiphilus sp.]
MPPRKTEVALLELTQAQFQALSDQKAADLLRAQTILATRRARHADIGLISGLLSYAIAVFACIYLAMHGFPKLAATALGAPILTVIKRMIDSRVN